MKNKNRNIIQGKEEDKEQEHIRERDRKLAARRSARTRFYYKRNRLKQLRGFCTVVQQNCSLTQASKVLGLERSALSLQIKSLEEDLGIKLFERNEEDNRGLSLSSEGRIFFRKAVTHLQGIDDLFDSFNRELIRAKENMINIGCDYVVATYILPHYLEHFKKRCDNFDDININIFNIGMNESVDKLRSGDLDFVLIADLKIREQFDDITRIGILKYDSVIITSNNYKNQKNFNKNSEFFRYMSLDKYEFFDPKKYLKINKSNITIENSNWTIIKEYVKRDLCIGGIPKITLSESDNHELNHFEMTDRVPEMAVYLCIQKNYGALGHRVKQLIDLIIGSREDDFEDDVDIVLNE